jgi:hypothetical protein
MFNNISVYEAHQILECCPKSKEQYKNLKTTSGSHSDLGKSIQAIKTGQKKF